MQEYIHVKGAREHNLKNIDIKILRDKLVVFTGLSGSGKSSLAFDTIYAEGQRRYVESLSSYARMFLGQMSKPDLDSIDGLSPAVSIDQKTTSKNPRSTVGTTTEIYDYLRLLFARVGVPHCPECGRVIKKQTTDQVTDEILALAPDAKAIIMAPVVAGRKGEFTKLFADLQKEGFSRVRIDGEIVKLDGEPRTLNKKIKHFIDVVVDRVQLKASATSRIAEAVELATKLADGRVLVQVLGGRFGYPHLWRSYTDLATLGTVADLMPMRGENRALVADGIRRMNDAPRPCIAALLGSSGAADKPVSATNLSFSVIPRLNAAGRMGDAQRARPADDRRLRGGEPPGHEAGIGERPAPRPSKPSCPRSRRRRPPRSTTASARWVVSGESWHEA